MPGVLPNTIPGRLIQVLSFQETVWGTPGPATARWMGITPTPQFTPKFQSVTIDEDRGSFQPGFVSYIPELGGTFTVNWDASFEDILFALSGVLGTVTPTGGPNYVWTFAAPGTSPWAPQSYTLEYAYNIANLVAQGCLTTKLQIKGNSKKNVTMTQSGIYQIHNKCAAIAIASSTNASPIAITTSTPHGLITGQQVVIAGHTVNTAANGTWTIIKTGASAFTLTGTTGNGIGGATGTVTQTLTPAIADRSVEAMLFAGETTLAIDAAAATPGTTSVPSALVSYTLEIDNALQGFFTGDQKYPTDFTEDKLKIMLTIKLKWNAQVKALYDTQWSLGNRTIFQITVTSASKTAVFTFAGILSADPQNYNLDMGAITQEFKFDAQYDIGTLANSFKAVITNTIATLP